MKKQKFPNTMNASVRYWLFQIPEFVVVLCACGILVYLQWITRNTASYVILAWFVKDLILYPLTVHAYRVDPPKTGTQRMIGLTTILKQPLQAEGMILIRGERWKASPASGQSIPAGTKVRVVHTDQSTLLVEPILTHSHKHSPSSHHEG